MRLPSSQSALRQCLAVVLSIACAAPVWAQDSVAPVKPIGSIAVRPYKAAFIPPAPLANSGRLRSLVQAGKLYLTVQDAIALALENNIDIEIDRYNPLTDQWNLERYEGGGALPGVTSGQSLAGSVASGQGVAGSQAAAGVSTSASSQNSGSSVGATISQIGPVTPTLDPAFQYSAAFAHRTTLEPDEVQSGIYSVLDLSRNYTATLSQGLLTGGQASITYRESYLNENAPSDTPNPTYAPSISISFQHNLLQGFGTAVNSRFITTAKATLKADDLTFKGAVIGAVANVLTLYYGLVADYQDVKAKQAALDVAQQFFENNKKEVQLGAMAPLDVTTAEAQVASSQQDLVVSQTNLEQQQVSLKNVLSRNGLADPVIAEAEIIPLDHIEVPEQDNLPPLKDMLAMALRSRTDLAVQKINLSNSEISNLGTENGLLPQLAVLLGASSQGLAGPYKLGVIPNAIPVSSTTSGSQSGTTTTNPVSGSSGSGSPGAGATLPPGFANCPSGIPTTSVCITPLGNFVGGIGNGLSQTFRRDFPSERAGGFVYAAARNRQAQADYGIDQLTLRQSQLQYQQALNQLAVDVSNGIVGVQQARVRYLASVKSRVLEQQLLDAEQKKFSLGASTTFLVVQQQRDLATAQSAEIAALVAYSNARVSLDQTLGTTLDQNHVSIQEAVRGRVSRVSTLPAPLPENAPQPPAH
ncbi:MAG: TolC family protein [Acidobacteriaceae bacterium]|nr:TolC family protein [Acidobacteriaceae bacterium]